MQALTIEQAADRLAGLERAVILYHAAAGWDAVGSAFPFGVRWRCTGATFVRLPRHEIPLRLRFLVDLDGEDAQESALSEALPERFADAPVVSVDTASPKQAGSLEESFLPRCVLMLDHHAAGTPYADHYILPEASATGELLYPLLLHLCGGDRLDLVTAARLFAAIASDTGCFKFSNTTAATHRTAADLLDTDFSTVIEPAEITRRLFDVKTAQVLKAEQLALSNLRVIDIADGLQAAVTTLTQAERQSISLRPEDTETMIDAVRVVDGCAIAATVKQQDNEPRWRISLRSTGPDVAAVAAMFGGGGHIRAAGCAIDAETADKAVEKLMAAIKSSAKA